MFTEQGEDEGSDENQWKRKQSFKANSMEVKGKQTVQRVQAAILCTNKRARSHRGMLESRLVDSRAQPQLYPLAGRVNGTESAEVAQHAPVLDNFMIIDSRHTSVPLRSH